MRSNTSRSGCDFTRSSLQELVDCRLNRQGQSLHVIDRNVALAALDRTNVRPMHASLFSHFFLRKAEGLTMVSQIVAKNLANISLASHEFTLDNVMPLRLQTLSSIQ